jgi:hypothetical protein
MCMFCAVELHFECENPKADSESVTCCCPDKLVTASESAKRGGPLKTNGEEMADVLSTGRKRAVIAAPIDEHTICEWAGLKRSGGGVYPIVGCVGSPATDRHHGPDKSVLNNEVGINLHRICSKCHNRWHTLNDPEYGERPPYGAPFLPVDKECLPHDPDTKATNEEIFQYEMSWANKKVVKQHE